MSENKKIDIRVQKTYDKLYNSFFTLLENEPYENITVLEICNATGVHRATFYKHFNDKQDFVNFCFNKKIGELDLSFDNGIFNSSTKTYYIDVCKKIISFVCENKKFIVDLNLSVSSSSTFSDALEKAIAYYLEKRITYRVTNGSVIMSPVPLLAHYYAGAVVSLLKAWASDWEKYTKEDILKFFSLRYNELELSYKHNKSLSTD